MITKLPLMLLLTLAFYSATGQSEVTDYLLSKHNNESIDAKEYVAEEKTSNLYFEKSIDDLLLKSFEACKPNLESPITTYTNKPTSGPGILVCFVLFFAIGTVNAFEHNKTEAIVFYSLSAVTGTYLILHSRNNKRK